MHLNERIETFISLGNQIGCLIKEHSRNQAIGDSKIPLDTNAWFTARNVIYALENVSRLLSSNSLNKWLVNYPKLTNYSKSKSVGLVTAGNIPLVGFHDVLCILLSGHRLIIKHSSKDEKLMEWLLKQIIQINPDYSNFITAESNHLKNFDAIIATGSDNTSKYFEYYFGKYPNIIRKNRNSVAILTGSETVEELQMLADDMLLYYGLGCRNVSKLFIPENFNVQRIFEALYAYHELINHHKYANNFIYNKSIYLMNKVPFLENGFLILKEDEGMDSPISVVFYQKYNNIKELKEKLNFDKEQIQCIISKHPEIEEKIFFGEAQKPELWDYADNVDTMNFLLSLE